MSYKIPSTPSARAYLEEIADFWEIEAILNPNTFVSSMNLIKAISPELDELDHEGIDSEDDKLLDRLNEVFKELETRVNATNNRYPFEFGKFSIKHIKDKSITRIIYIFLLLATRFDMSLGKKKAGLDATQIFEKLCLHISKNYFGINSKSLILGTALPGTFREKVIHLTQELGEGKGFKNPNPGSVIKKDDGVDIVVWKEFSDRKVGKLIGFVQCKTGDTWRETKHRLDPDRFCKSWLKDAPISNPLKMLFLCDTMNQGRHFITDQLGFLVLNRFRIMEFIPENIVSDRSLIREINAWVKEALKELKQG